MSVNANANKYVRKNDRDEDSVNPSYNSASSKLALNLKLDACARKRLSRADIYLSTLTIR